MRVSIIGAGYVGLVSGVGLAEVGHQVVCVDRDGAKIDLINQGTAPIYEEGLQELLSSNLGKRLRASTDLGQAVQATDLTLIAVGTSSDGDRTGLQSIKEASREVGEALATKAEYHTVVVKSTVLPGTTDSIVLPILEQASGRRAGEDFGVGMNPEFLREGNAIGDFMTPDRIVLGGIDKRSQDALAELYAPFTGAEQLRTNTRTAEMIKYTANSLLATLISFSNEIANLTANIGVDAMEAMRGVHLDKRFTPPNTDDGSRVWPGAINYLEPGCGFGGSCLPKDVEALIAFGTEQGSPMRILQAVSDVNKAQPAKMLELLRRQIPDLQGVPITVLGMAFKPGTDDVRRSPSLEVTERLLAEEARVIVYDPVANHEVARVFGDRVAYAESLESALDQAQGVLIMTGWGQFRRIPDLLRDRDRQPVVVDGRRLLPKDSVTRYEGIGL